MIDATMQTGPSGRVQSVTAVGSQGESTMTGSDLRRAMNLRSTWFRIGVLSLATPQAPVTYGKNVALSGVARGCRRCGSTSGSPALRGSRSARSRRARAAR